MPQLIIKIKDKIAKPLNNCVICDNSDYTVKFIFDEEWEKEPLRIARFIWNKQYVDVQFTGDTCEVPVVSKTNNLAIGVYAGDLRTTTPAILTCYTSILSEDVVEHSVTPSEYEEIMKLLNAQATDIAALKAVDKRIWTNLDTINKTASTAKIKAEEGVAKADDALTATRTNATNINSLTTDVNSLRTDVNALKSVDERIWTNLDTINKTASTAKIKAEEGVAKADDALARNIFTDEEKAKLANITNPMVIKGRVDTANDLPTEAEIGWFYFVGLESASSYEEYCYSENGWEYIGLSQEGVDLSNYYTKKQVDTTVNELKAIDNSLGTRIDNVDSKASAAKIKAEEGVAKADNALAATRTNATNISTHETRLDSIDNTLSSHDTRITTAQQKANSVDEKVDSTNEVVGQLSTSLQSAYNKINAHANDIAINRTTLGAQCKNLLKINAVTQTINGVTFTINDDKSITVNGTATAQISFAVNNKVGLDIGNYILTGCPSGGSKNTFYLTAYASLAWLSAPDFGSGCKIENKTITHIVISIASGYTANNLTFSPMLRDADITDDTYEPYKENVDERLIENKSDIAVNKSAIAVNKSALGYQRKNLLPYPKSIVRGGITFTCDENGYMTGSNTTSDTRQWTSANAQYSMYLEAGTYYFSSFAETVCTNSDGRAYIIANGTQIVGVSTRETHVEKMFTLSEATTIYVMAKVYDGKIAFMIREADITDDSYEPYKPSLFERCLLKDTAGINLGAVTQSSSITIDNLSSYTALWINVSGAVAGISFMTNLIVPIAYLAKSTSNSVQLAGGIPSSAYITSEGPLAAKNMSGYITAKVNGNTLDLTISDGTIGSVEVISLM